MYEIKAIPTVYNGVRFRSRLEARWAAFFDLCGWKWDYEPLDLEGWAPDFSLETPVCTVFIEVKPVEKFHHSEISKTFGKAIAHWDKVQVLLLGLKPRDWFCIGFLLDPPKVRKYQFADLWEHLRREDDQETLWREAGNRVQWRRGS
jgi:hypothetical protein